MARYKQLLFFAAKLPPLPAEAHTPENKVEGCVSQVCEHLAADTSTAAFAHPPVCAHLNPTGTRIVPCPTLPTHMPTCLRKPILYIYTRPHTLPPSIKCTGVGGT